MLSLLESGRGTGKKDRLKTRSEELPVSPGPPELLNSTDTESHCTASATRQDERTPHRSIDNKRLSMFQLSAYNPLEWFGLCFSEHTYRMMVNLFSCGVGPHRYGTVLFVRVPKRKHSEAELIARLTTTAAKALNGVAGGRLRVARRRQWKYAQEQNGQEDDRKT